MITGKYDLDTPILNFSNEPSSSAWTIRNAVEGLQIFGGIGGGKTSGSGRTIAKKYLELGFGGLVLTCKADEKDQWIEYASQTGRLKDLIIVEPGGTEYFNFFDYLSNAHHPKGTTIIGNIVEALKTVIAASQEKTGHGNDDMFWEQALDMLVYNAISLCMLSFGKIEIDKLCNIVLTAPKKDKPKEKNTRTDSFDYIFSIANEKVQAQIKRFEDHLTIKERKYFKENEVEYEKAILNAIPDAFLIKQIDQFFIETYSNLSEKTRSIIEFTFSGFLFMLMKEPIYSLFCKSRSTFSPEACLEGKIIILNIPTKIFHKAGRDTQIMFKYIWQKAMEQRNIAQNNRPIFIFSDEAQSFLHSHDADFQATARGFLIATVYLSQNIPNYYASMGGINSDNKVKSFLGTMGTKIFHSNACLDTNRWASELIGSGYQKNTQWSNTMAGNFSRSESDSFSLEQMVRPEEFLTLKTGGAINNFVVEAYIHRQGNSFANRAHFKKISFSQK